MKSQAARTLKTSPWAGLATVLHFPKPQTKKDIQILRKLWHMGMILTVVYLYTNVITTRVGALTALLTIGGAFSFFDISRLWVRPFNKFVIGLFGSVMRKREMNSVSATTPFILSSFVVIAFFPKDIAILSLLCLAFGDVAAGVIGIKFGKDKLIEGKSLQGSLACFTVCFLLTAAFIYIQNISSPYVPLMCLMGGLAPTIAELFSSKKLDDNFTIPVVTAFVIYFFSS